MGTDSVKARRVGDSVVITLTKSVLEGTGIAEGDPLLIEVLAEGRALIAKEDKPVSAVRKLELELEVLNRRKSALEAELDLACFEHNNSMPSAHPGIDDDLIMDGYAKETIWNLRKLDLEFAEKRLLLFELTGQSEGVSDAGTDNKAPITEEEWRGFLADRTDLQLDVINVLRGRGGEITLRELVGVTKGKTRELGGVISSLNRQSQKLWGIAMIEQRRRVQHPDGKTEYGYDFNDLVPWELE